MTCFPVHLMGPLGLFFGYEAGSAFSLFTGRTSPVLAVVAVMRVGVLIWLAWRARSAAVAVALGLVLGGRLGTCRRPSVPWASWPGGGLHHPSPLAYFQRG